MPNFASGLERLALRGWLFFKALRTPCAVGAMAIAEDGDGRVILVRHTYQAGWHLPGGGVGAGEPPAEAALRELREEIGLLSSDPLELVGVFTRKFGIVTNLVALYRVRNVVFDFKPNREIKEVMRADPAALPPGIVPGARRRLAEHLGHAARSLYW